MKRDLWSVLIACALGAFIGTLVSLELGARFQYGTWFSWIGALIGGSTAYLAVDFRQMCAGIARAYRRTVTWRPEVQYWKAVWMLFWGLMALFTSILLASAPVGVLLVAYSEPSTSILLWRILLVFEVALTLGAICAAVSVNTWPEERERGVELWLQNQRAGERMLRNLNPIALTWRAASFAGQGLWWTLRNVPRIARATRNVITMSVDVVCRISVLTFMYTHSDRRTICFVAAALGSGIGYLCGSATIGALAGAVTGLVSHELIAIRWLGLIRQKTAD